jgi:hypothetical protein
MQMLNKQELEAAREWLKDLVFADIDDPEQIDELSDAEVEQGIKRHFSGGIKAFKATF